MDGILLGKTDLIYGLKTEYRELKTQDYISEYSCIWHVKALYDNTVQSYEFSLDRSEVKINNREPEKLMDRIMFETGSSLYPVRFKVSKQMEISQIINYAEITGRWKETAGKCSDEYPGDVMNRYMEYSAASLSNPRTFLRSLYNDSFINLYFRNLYILPQSEDERERIELNNFPLREMKSTYYCTIKAPEANMRKLEGTLMAIISDQKGTASIDYTYGKQGEPENITGIFTAGNDSRQFQKKITVTELSSNERDNNHVKP